MERKGAGMTGMLPITEQLEECTSDAERAKWLLNVPAFIFYRDQTNICRLLRAARFMRGVELVDAELALLLAVRGNDGEPPADIYAIVNAMRAFMRMLVRKGGLV
jgi:hypothetical protein